MTLFGSNKKHDNDANLHNTDDHSDKDYPIDTPATGPGFNGVAGVYSSSTAAQGHYGGQALAYDNHLTPKHHDTTHNHTTHNDQAAGTNIPPTGAVHNCTTPHSLSGGGVGERFTGKVEYALGSLVGSNALKEKGLQKQQGTHPADSSHGADHIGTTGTGGAGTQART